MAQRLIATFVILLVSFLVFYFGVWNVVVTIRDLSHKIDAVQQRLSEGKKVIAGLEEMENRAREHQEAATKLQDLFLRGGNIEDAALMVQRITEERGMVLIDMTLGQKTSPKDRISSAKSQAKETRLFSQEENTSGKKQEARESPAIILYSLSVRIGGAYENFKSFLEVLENNLPLISVEKYAVFPPQKLDDQLFEFGVDLTFYFEE